MVTVIADYRETLKTQANVGTLPVGYRPLTLIISNFGATNFLQISSSGEVILSPQGEVFGWCIQTVSYGASNT